MKIGKISPIFKGGNNLQAENYRVFIDLKKAFDTVNHEILLNKLKLYGINGTCLEWFKSYLSNRNQCIVYDVYNNIKNLSTKISCVVCPRDPSWARCSF